MITRALAETAVHFRDFSFYEDPYAGGLTLSEIRNPAEFSQLSREGYFAYRNLTSFNISFAYRLKIVLPTLCSSSPIFSAICHNLKKFCIDIDELRPMENSVRMQCT